MIGQLAAFGAPLPQDKCEQLQSELTLLEGGGAGENIQRGAEWGKANLTPEQLKYVERLILVREDLLFRCRSFEVVRAPPPPAVAPNVAPVPVRRPGPPVGAPTANTEPGQEVARGVPLPSRPSASAAEKPAAGGAPPPPTGKPKKPASQVPGRTDGNARPAADKKQRRAKANDAYVAPADAPRSTFQQPAEDVPSPALRGSTTR